MTKRTLPFLTLLALLALAALACNYADRLLSDATATPAASTAAGQATAVPQPVQPRPELVASPTPPPTPAQPEQPPLEAATVAPDAVASGVRPDQQDTFQSLASSEPPERDALEVARLYGGWDGTLRQPPANPEPLTVETVQPFRILNHDDITYSTGQFVLKAVSDHAYFWFSDQTPAGWLTPELLDAASQAFDDIYEQDVAIFGPENRPGVDGDLRLHIVNAWPGQLCAQVDACGLAGYYSSDDVVPSEVDPDSNARDMFVMNVEYFGTDFYLDVLAHEFRHMIEDNYDHGDDAWEGEGSAMLAEDLLGYAGSGVARANLFLSQPDQQLNSWTDGDTFPYYGMGYLLNRYIYDRLGPELYRQFAGSPATSLVAIDEVAAANDLAISGHQLWQDWLAAMALIGRDDAPELYRFGVPGLDPPAMTEVRRFPAEFDETVSQYAVDYYALRGSDEIAIDFAGAPTVPLLDVPPFSGDGMWLADRANNSHARLTRTLDLTGVSAASLEYSVYHDIEAGYDFAYVFISTDGGQTFQPLTAEHMQGPADDPSDSALADHFYTGSGGGWQRERIDLTPYAGQEVQIRFAYLTDQVLTFSGIALDDIAVPEIGLFDDVETFDDAETLDDGWTAEGFERVTGDIPQRWDLQLITFGADGPRVEPLPLNGDQTLSRPLDLSASDGRAILVVSAWAPMTLQAASYQLSFSTP
jgi:immune inhibitor A